MPPKKRKENEEPSEPDAKKSKSENGSEEDGKRPASDEQAAEHTCAETSQSTKNDEKRKLSKPEPCGTLLMCGGTNWDMIGRKEPPKSAGNVGGPNLWEPHLISTLDGIRIRFIASGPTACHSVLVTESGTAMVFGRNDKGQLGNGTTERANVPKVIDSLKHFKVVQAMCGKAHTLVLTDEGLLFGFGENKMAQLGQGHQKASITRPVQIAHPENKMIKKIGCGMEFSMFIDEDNRLYSFGSPEHGQLGHNTDGQYFVSANKLAYDCQLLPRRVNLFIERGKDGFVTPIKDVKVTDVVCGNNHSIVMDENNRIFTWGFGGYGRLGHQQPKDEHVPRLLSYFNNRTTESLYAGSTYSMAVSMGQLFFWGQTKLSGEATMYPKPVQDLMGWKIRSVGCSKTSVVVAADDSVVSWGPSPTYGELGYGLKKGGQKSSTNPKIVDPLEGIFIERVACGCGHSMFIARDDQLGDREKLDRLPVYDPSAS